MATSLGSILLPLLLLLLTGPDQSTPAKFTFTNNCNETIHPGITPNTLGGGGFTLRPTESTVLAAPPSWRGRIWARTNCTFDRAGNGTCQTGSCGPSLRCSGPGIPPASIAEFVLGSGGGLDYYDVSLVDGFNVAIAVRPVGGRGTCSSAGCDADMRAICPPELAAGPACRSACGAFRTDEYCCRGAFSTPVACLPTNYSRIFKAACPAAYSFAYDDPTSIMTCSDADYVISFCSSRNQTQCTYDAGNVVCNGARGALKGVFGVCHVIMLFLGVAFL